MSGRTRTPKVGSRYLITGGVHKGSLCVVREKLSAGETVFSNMAYKATLCDCWGGPTGRDIVVRLVELEI